MKKANQLIYITNIIFCILVIIVLMNQSHSLYDSFSYMFSILCLVVMIINIIISIINFKKKEGNYSDNRNNSTINFIFYLYES